MRAIEFFVVGAVLFSINCTGPIPPSGGETDTNLSGNNDSVDVMEPDFGDEVKELPRAGALQMYTPSLNSKYYNPVSIRYKTKKSAGWSEAKARIDRKSVV